MTDIDLAKTRTSRVEWVQSYVIGLHDLPHRPENYKTADRWEGIIAPLMGSARDFDANRLYPDSGEHVTEAVKRLGGSDVLERLNCPLTEVSRMMFAREMAYLIVDAADAVDSRLLAGKEREVTRGELTAQVEEGVPESVVRFAHGTRVLALFTFVLFLVIVCGVALSVAGGHFIP